MARNARQRLSSRTDVSQRDTYRRTPGIKPIANPVQSYTGGNKGGSTLNQLTEALEMGGNLVETYSRMETQTNRIEQQEGQRAAKRGDEAPEDASQPYMYGYLRVKGESDAAQFENDANQLIRENWNEDPETFQKRLEKLEQDYLQEKSEAYLEGFVPKANAVEQKTLSEYQKAQYKQQTVNFLDNTANSFTQDVEWIKDQNYSEKKKAKNIRQALSYYQKQGKNMGLTRDQVTTRLLSVAGGKAEEEADPDLLSFIREPGQGSGVRVIDTKLGEKARRWEQAALQAQQQEEENREAQLEEKRGELKEQIHRDFVNQISSIDPSNDRALRNMKAQLRTVWNNPNNNKFGVALDPKDMESLMGTIDDMLEPAGFANSTDTDTYTGLKTQAKSIDSKTEADSILETLRARRGELTRPDYRHILGDVLRERNSLENREVNDFKNMFSSFRTKRLKVLQEASTGLFALDEGERRQQDYRRVAHADEEMKIRVAEWREKNEGVPGYPELRRIWDEVRKDAYEMYPDTKMVDATGSGSGDEGRSGSEDAQNERRQKVMDRLNQNQE